MLRVLGWVGGEIRAWGELGPDQDGREGSTGKCEGGGRGGSWEVLLLKGMKKRRRKRGVQISHHTQITMCIHA
jgi:hypothetical protein